MNAPSDAAKGPKPFKGKNILKDGEAKYLIYYSDDNKDGEVGVYVDSELDLDWEADDKYTELFDHAAFKDTVSEVLTGMAELEPIAHSWPADLKLMAKRVLGEALACAFRKDKKGAHRALRRASMFFATKSRQVSRYWTLQSCLTVGAIAVLFGIVDIAARDFVISLFGRTTYLLSLCFWAGCAGSVLFVGLRLGREQRVDSTAERHLHYLEGCARIVCGGISGVLVGSMVHLGLVLPVFGKSDKEVLAMCAAAMIAGASERLVAGVVTSVESGKSKAKESPNAD